MKVKCIKIYNEYDKEYKEKSFSLTIGNEYVILEISSGADQQLAYRLISDTGTSSIFKAFQFDVVSEIVPSSWCITICKEYGCIDIGPAIWRESDFWEAFFDGEAWAKDVYKKEVEKIYAEEEKK